MGKLLLAVVGFMFITLQTAAAESSERISEMKVLDRWVGSWTSNLVAKPSAWILGGMQRVETKKVDWILDYQFQQATIRSTGDHGMPFPMGDEESREIHRYDPKSKTYQKWTFNSKGESSFWSGSWNQKTKKMTWKLEFVEGVLKGKMEDHFLKPGKYETTLVLEDMRGTVLVDVHVRHIRVSETN